MFLEFIVFILCSLNFYSNFDLFSSLLKFVICKGKQERGNNYEEGLMFQHFSRGRGSQLSDIRAQKSQKLQYNPPLN